jgi:AcrR family transcriptional regulator
MPPSPILPYPMKHQAFHSPKARRQRVNDPEGTKRNIIEIATTEFARKGFSGARVDNIAARTKTSKRMIYYYFGGKEGLYIAVLETAYRNMRSVEGRLDVQHQEPKEALHALIAHTFDYQSAHPEFVRRHLPPECRPGRSAHDDQRPVVLQRRQPPDLLHDLQARHGVGQIPCGAPRTSDRHRPALRRGLKKSPRRTRHLCGR